MELLPPLPTPKPIKRKKLAASNHLKKKLPRISMNDLVFEDCLGRGGFGTVYKCYWLSKQLTVACKIIHVKRNVDESLEKSFFRELEAYASLSGPNILKTFAYGHETLSGGGVKYVLVMEYMKKGSLTILLENEKLSYSKKLKFACDIACGMLKIHENNMIHRDIRPDNILINDDYVAKIGDMGIARNMSLSSNHTRDIGCLVYMPPEYHNVDEKYDKSLDIFSFGLTLLELFTTPCKNNKPCHVFDNSTKKVVIKKKSPIFWDLISRCLDDDPKRRPTSVEINQILNRYKAAFVDAIQTKYVYYNEVSERIRNSIFLEVYENLHSKLQVAPLRDTRSIDCVHLPSLQSESQPIIPPPPRVKSDPIGKQENKLPYPTIQNSSLMNAEQAIGFEKLYSPLGFKPDVPLGFGRIESKIYETNYLSTQGILDFL
ncbi:unnamed protein product [Didymodactylos carnosus]|uniref:Protein kinase domain-containing protein n=1 Tax=Didymodactylos carnosus TaxID=1234261 RepID=A0A815BWW0_9BILA|nr:unnamed protein product [Didymodactylos carnosus]CAF4070230.1 unnamed protein product [Didymodactylos carnosus]